VNVVLDASILVEFLAQPSSPVDVEELYRSGASFHVPAICDTEVVSGLSRRVRAGLSSELDARDALIEYVGYPLARHLHPGLLGRVFELRDNMSARDAAYVALAEVLDARLVTVDRALARAVRRHTDVPVMP
jgi:predicted nucleic acid-binding protein